MDAHFSNAGLSSTDYDARIAQALQNQEDNKARESATRAPSATALATAAAAAAGIVPTPTGSTTPGGPASEYVDNPNVAFTRELPLATAPSSMSTYPLTILTRPSFSRWNWLAVPTGLALIVAAFVCGRFGQKVKAGALVVTGACFLSGFYKAYQAHKQQVKDFEVRDYNSGVLLKLEKLVDSLEKTHLGDGLESTSLAQTDQLYIPRLPEIIVEQDLSVKADIGRINETIIAIEKFHKSVILPDEKLLTANNPLVPKSLKDALNQLKNCYDGITTAKTLDDKYSPASLYLWILFGNSKVKIPEKTLKKCAEDAMNELNKSLHMIDGQLGHTLQPQAQPSLQAP